MARQLFLEGFILRPIAHAIDLDDGNIDPYNLGEMKVKLDDLKGFAETQWPDMWESLRGQFAEAQAEEARIAQTQKPNRSARRKPKPEPKGLRAVPGPTRQRRAVAPPAGSGE